MSQSELFYRGRHRAPAEVQCEVVVGDRQKSGMGQGRRHRKRNRRKQETSTVISHSNRDEYILLKKWISDFDKSVKLNLEPCLFQDTGRGLQTRQKIEPGDVIVSIPVQSLITCSTVLHSDIGAVVKKFNPPLSPQRILSIFLTYELSKGRKSFWYPYINSLPTSFTTPLYFSCDELKLLPTTVYEKANREQRRVYDIWQDVSSFLRHVTNHEYCMWEAFRWAWCVVNSRSVYVKTKESPFVTLTDKEKDVALAPYLDLLNHSSYAKTEARLNEETGRFELITYNHYEKYSQVFIYYNPYSNESLFLEYGFTLPENPYNVYEFIQDDISMLKKQFNIPSWDKRDDIIRENELDRGLTCSLDGLSWKLQTLLRIQAMTWKELKSWKNVYQDVPKACELKAVNMAEWLAKKAMEQNKPFLIDKTDVKSEHERLAVSLAEDNQDMLQKMLTQLQTLSL